MRHPRRATVAIFFLLGVSIFLRNPARLRSSFSCRQSSWTEQVDRDVLNETLGFDKIFVINLPARSDRRDAMTLAGALTGLKFDWVDGVSGDDVPEKVLPADSLGKGINKGNKGSWRAHMNALRTTIQQNLTTALIVEDDIDWDIRLKPQLRSFSLASRTYLDLLARGQTHQHTISLPSHPHTLPQQSSPYGSGWDVLWLGHCGTDFPPTDHQHLPAHRVELPDATVPGPQHLRPHPLADGDGALASQHPAHARVVHAAGAGTICTQAYAVSRRGAARLLWRFGTDTFTTGWDLMLRDWCGGAYGREAAGGDGDGPVCVTVQPPLFVHHYGKGGGSDITAPGGGFVDRGGKEMSPYVRKSVRLNMGRLVMGQGVGELDDQWPD